LPLVNTFVRGNVGEYILPKVRLFRLHFRQRVIALTSLTWLALKSDAYNNTSLTKTARVRKEISSILVTGGIIYENTDKLATPRSHLIATFSVNVWWVQRS